MRGCSSYRVDFNPIFMKYLFFSMVVIWGIFSTLSLFAWADWVTRWNITEIRPQVRHIISLGKSIEVHLGEPILDRLIAHRQKILEQVESNLNNLGWIRTQATLDISESYHLTLQKYKLSCEVAGLRMMMESLTHSALDEDEIIGSLHSFPGPLSSGSVWWDPDTEFVGSITGSQFWHTGYGIYESPLKHYVQSLGYTADTYNRWSSSFSWADTLLTHLFDDLEEWHRVMLWWDWCTLPAYEDGMLEDVDAFVVEHTFLNARNPCSRSYSERRFSWKTPDGKMIQWLSGEHVFLLLGYRGKKEHPDSVIVWDTDTGKHIFSYTEWMRKWSALDYRALSIIR